MGLTGVLSWKWALFLIFAGLRCFPLHRAHTRFCSPFYSPLSLMIAFKGETVKDQHEHVPFRLKMGLDLFLWDSEIWAAVKNVTCFRAWITAILFVELANVGGASSYLVRTAAVLFCFFLGTLKCYEVAQVGHLVSLSRGWRWGPSNGQDIMNEILGYRLNANK